MQEIGMGSVKELRYYVMLALYFPILLYAFSTFDLSEENFVVQQFTPVVVGSEQVVLGQPFVGRAFLAVGSGQGQRLEGEGSLRVVGDSLFSMETGKLLEPDESEKEVGYTGAFNFTQVGGSVATIPVSGRFKVRRPDIVAMSEATQTLYRNCANRVRIEVPGLENRPLRLVSGSSRVDGRSLQLSPSGERADVRVFLADEGGDVYLGSKAFAVIDPPRPEIKVSSGGRPVNNGDNLSRRRALLEFEVKADESFKQRFPSDARYAVGRATVFLRKGLTASREIGTFDLKDNKLVLTRVLRDAQPGDRVMVRLQSVTRINHSGRSIPVAIGEASRTFGFVISG